MKKFKLTSPRPRSRPLAAQLAGAMAVLVAVTLLAGPVWALLAGGVALLAVGALAEAGWF